MEHNKYPVVCNPISDYVQQNPVPGHPASDIYPWELSYGTFDRKYWDNIDNFGFRTVKVKIKRNIKDPTYTSLVVRPAQ